MYGHVDYRWGKERPIFNLDALSKLSCFQNNRRKVNYRHTFPCLDAKSLTEQGDSRICLLGYVSENNPKTF